jgi:hypothetical protein
VRPSLIINLIVEVTATLSPSPNKIGSPYLKILKSKYKNKTAKEINGAIK